MCAIVGYLGSQSALDVLLAGLKRLEPEGCDAAGVAVLADGGLAAAKKAGPVAGLERELTRRPLPTGTTGIGHVRRATHGGPTDVNAHPQLDASGRVAVVHNGTLDNYAELRAEMAEHGHRLDSETDTEPVAHLLAEAFSASGDLADSMRRVCARLRGTFTLVAVHADDPDVVVGARRGLPLLAAVGDGEAVLASAAEALPAAPGWTRLEPWTPAGAGADNGGAADGDTGDAGVPRADGDAAPGTGDAGEAGRDGVPGTGGGDGDGARVLVLRRSGDDLRYEEEPLLP